MTTTSVPLDARLDIRGEVISSGTLRVEDLIAYFTDALEYLNPDTEIGERGVDMTEAIALQSDDHNTLPDHLVEEGHEVLEGLFEALDELSPEGYCSGSHPGDGALFGWWPAEDF